MPLTPKIYGCLGDARLPFTSIGFENYLKSLRTLAEVQIIEDGTRELNNVVYDAFSQPSDRMLIGLGYSLGGNFNAWWQQALRLYCVTHYKSARKIALLVGFDPTKNSRLDLYPIEPHVGRCLCFRNYAWWFPVSAVFGRGEYVRAAKGPPIEITKTYMDHLWVQSSSRLQEICTTVIKDEIEKWNAAHPEAAVS